MGVEEEAPHFQLHSRPAAREIETDISFLKNKIIILYLANTKEVETNTIKYKTLITVVVYDCGQNILGFQTNTKEKRGKNITQNTCFQSFVFLSLEV